MCVCAARQRQSVRPAQMICPKRPMMSTLRQAFRSAARSSGTAASVRHVQPPRRCACAAIAHGAAQRSSLFFWFQGPSCARRSDAPPRARVCFEVAPRSPWRLLPPPPTPKSARMPHLVALLAAPFGSRTAAQALRGRALRRAARGSRGGRAHQPPHDRHARASSCQPLSRRRTAANLAVGSNPDDPLRYKARRRQRLAATAQVAPRAPAEHVPRGGERGCLRAARCE